MSGGVTRSDDGYFGEDENEDVGGVARSSVELRRVP